MGEWGLVCGRHTAGLQVGLRSLSGAGFLLVMGRDPQVMGFGVPCALPPFFPFFFHTAFTTTTRVIFLKYRSDQLTALTYQA